MTLDAALPAPSFEAWSHICAEQIDSQRKVAVGNLEVARRHIADITQGRCRFSASYTRQSDRLLSAEARLGASAFQFLRWDWDAECETTTVRPPEQNVVVYIPLKGIFEASQGGRSATAGPGEILVVSSEGQLRRRWQGNCELLNVVLAREALLRLLAIEFAVDPVAPMRFEPLAVIGQERAATLFGFVETVLRDLSSPSPMFAEPVAGKQAERLLLHILLKCAPHDYADRVQGRQSDLAPYYVRRAERFIRDHIESDISVDRLIEAAGVSARTLYYGFKQYKKMSPMKYLRRTRLMHANATLQETRAQGRNQGRRISDVAARVGYKNVSQFSRDYKKYFGVSPMDTVRGRTAAAAPGHELALS